MQQITVQAPAKVNTVLRVVGRRPDGYHDLEMVMVPLSLADEIVLERRPSGVTFSLDGGGDDGMEGEKNLAVRAARALLIECGLSEGVAITLAKRVPIAAGLGGGSSDAAAVLRGMNALFELGLSAEALARIGGRLGADVPFFCFDSAAFVTGTGDRVEPIGFPNCSVLLINPGFAVSTPWAYGEWDRLQNHRENKRLTGPGSGARVPPASTPDGRGCPPFPGLQDVVAALHNDLEAATIPEFPEIGEIKRQLMEAGAAGALMSGSGPTVFGLFADRGGRDAAVAAIHNERWRVFPAEMVTQE